MPALSVYSCRPPLLSDRRPTRVSFPCLGLPGQLSRPGKRSKVCQIFPPSAEPAAGSGVEARYDPGDFEFTREWASGGAWGKGSGKVVYSESSQHGNGTIMVTAHKCSWEDAAGTAHAANKNECTRLYQQWRVLHFDHAGHKSDQSVARTTICAKDGVTASSHMQADCLAFQYTKTLASLVAAVIGLQPGLQTALSGGAAKQRHLQCNALMIGLGGGSLPFFFADAFPGMHLTVVEIDPVVIRAAALHLGFPLDRAGLEVHEGDAIEFMAKAAKCSRHYDLVLLDAYNGANRVPRIFTDAGCKFSSDLAEVLHPEHGTFLMNLHGGRPPNPLVQLAHSFSADPMAGAGFDPSTREGGEVLRLSKMYRKVLLDTISSDTSSSPEPGAAFVVKALRQMNVSLVVSRGLNLPGSTQECSARMEQAADQVAQAGRYRFAAGSRAGHYLWRVPVGMTQTS